jgi:hypothetical protein
MMTTRPHLIGALCVLGVLTASPVTAQTRPSLAERLHAQAVESFRIGRFPEAYGRFVSLAEAGHPASARYALWMCVHGMELFGKDWDCSQSQVDDWARTAGAVAPIIGPRLYVTTTTPRPTARR